MPPGAASAAARLARPPSRSGLPRGLCASRRSCGSDPLAARPRTGRRQSPKPPPALGSESVSPIGDRSRAPGKLYCGSWRFRFTRLRLGFPFRELPPPPLPDPCEQGRGASSGLRLFLSWEPRPCNDGAEPVGEIGGRARRSAVFTPARRDPRSEHSLGGRRAFAPRPPSARDAPPRSPRRWIRPRASVSGNRRCSPVDAALVLESA